MERCKCVPWNARLPISLAIPLQIIENRLPRQSDLTGIAVRGDVVLIACVRK